jgi:Asp-tRNA(Asn)/Glu-tRNA(Gln) amidotransferase A subunit family amidase
VDPECVKAAVDAARLCESLGHVVEEASPPIIEPTEMLHAFTTLYSAGTAALIDDWARVTGRTPAADAFEPLTWALAEIGRLHSAPDYLGAVARLQRVGREVAIFLRGYDFLLSPTIAEPPARLGTFSSPPDMPLLGFIRAGAYVPFLTLANITGSPSMSVPLSQSADGLPIGVLFTGRNGDESGLFRLAAQLEAACVEDWLRSAPEPRNEPSRP